VVAVAQLAAISQEICRCLLEAHIPLRWVPAAQVVHIPVTAEQQEVTAALIVFLAVLQPTVAEQEERIRAEHKKTAPLVVLAEAALVQTFMV
jgi:hypothetical protein